MFMLIVRGMNILFGGYFRQHSIDESRGTLSLELVLSNSLLTDINVQVRSDDFTATGKLWANCLCLLAICTL